MSTESHDGQHHRRTWRSTRNLRSVLLAIGLLGLAIGSGFLVAAFVMGTQQFRLYGAVYILVALVLLGVRQILNEIRKQYRRRSHDDERAAASRRSP